MQTPGLPGRYHGRGSALTPCLTSASFKRSLFSSEASLHESTQSSMSMFPPHSQRIWFVEGPKGSTHPLICKGYISFRLHRPAIIGCCKRRHFAAPRQLLKERCFARHLSRITSVDRR